MKDIFTYIYVSMRTHIPTSLHKYVSNKTVSALEMMTEYTHTQTQTLSHTQHDASDSHYNSDDDQDAAIAYNATDDEHPRHASSEPGDQPALAHFLVIVY